jgi:very-short-patch-repair endonuclease
MGYELRTAVRFTEYAGRAAIHTAKVHSGDALLATLTYGHAATLWRINLGWKRRQNKQQYGFMLDTERGYWAKNDQLPDDAADDPMSVRTQRVIPYVEDTRNCLLFEPSEFLEPAVMASLQAALKTAIQVHFQLEDGELAAEPLPDANNRRLLLFYESAEGGAGVLRRLVDDASALASVAREALRICHFDPVTGADQHRAPRSREDCEAACYDCLMSYYNQGDHRLLDRKQIKDVLRQLAAATVRVSPVAASRADHLQSLLNLCDSELERKWLEFLDEHGYRLPSKAQVLIEACQTRPDFLYEDALAAVYIDGPHHEYPERQTRDTAQAECMEDRGYTVIRFSLTQDWKAVAARYPSVFGAPA